MPWSCHVLVNNIRRAEERITGHERLRPTTGFPTLLRIRHVDERRVNASVGSDGREMGMR